MNILRGITGAVLLAFTFACAAATANVKYGSASLLKERRVVAVVDVAVAQTESDSFMNALMLNMSDTLNQVTGNEVLREDVRGRFQEFLVNSINRNLLEKGFAPIQRRRIQSVLKEQAFQQSGLTEDPTRIGRLLDARAVYTGKLTIRKKDGFDYPLILACVMPVILIVPRPEANITFSGELTDVESGAVLASGSASKNVRDVKAEDVDEVIESWFDKLPEL